MEAVLQEIRAQVLDADARRTPLRLRGAGTKDFYGEQSCGELLDLSRWHGVVDYEPSELVITARCGTRLSTIEALLAGHGQFLPFEPPAFGGDPTIGGIVAAGLSGPARARAGAARDFVLGAQLLGIDGELLHFGGQVMKNVAGFDLSRLLCGSLGILGPMMQVSLKVLPLPRTQQTLRLAVDADEALTRFRCWNSLPLPINACAWADGAAWVRLCGAPSAVDTACRQLGGERIDAAAAAAWWRSVRDQTHPFFDAAELWRVSLPATAPPLPLPLPGAATGAMLMEWSGALRWYAVAADTATFRTLAEAAGGTAQRWRGEQAAPRFHPLSGAAMRLHERLKAKFDPHCIFNRGRLVGTL